MITTIIFDLSEVFFKGFYGVEDYLTEILGMKAKDIKDKLQGPEFKSLMIGKITEDEFWTRIIQRNKWKVEIKHFKKAVRDNFAEIKGTRRIINGLKKKGYKLVLLSDHCQEWIEYFNDKFGHHKLFDSTQYSFEVKCCKTDKKMFKLLLKKLKEKSSGCLFIDDSEDNIKVAKSMGLKTIKFDNPSRLKRDLTASLKDID